MIKDLMSPEDFDAVVQLMLNQFALNQHLKELNEVGRMELQFLDTSEGTPALLRATAQRGVDTQTDIIVAQRQMVANWHTIIRVLEKYP
jgi:hypothetical protein